jgi:hypothetical protein
MNNWNCCPHCPEQGVACAPLALRIIEKSLASDRLIIETIVNKYADYVPLYRQSVILDCPKPIVVSVDPVLHQTVQVQDIGNTIGSRHR